MQLLFILLSMSGIFTFLSILMTIIYLFSGFKEQISKRNVVATYFLFNSLSTKIFNLLISLSVLSYFICLILDIKLKHLSINIITSLWYICNCFPFFIYNGRLFYSFKRVKYRISQKLFISLNSLVVIVTPICVLFEIIPCMISTKHAKLWDLVQFILFNFYGIIYILLLLWLSYLFKLRIFDFIASKARLAEISTFNLRKYRRLIRVNTYDSLENFDRLGLDDIPSTSSRSENGSILDELNEISIYLNMVIKSSVLLLFVICCKISVIICILLHTLKFKCETSNSICILLLSVDCFIQTLCVFLVFSFSERYYICICGLTCADHNNANDSNMSINDEYEGCHRLCYGFCVKCGTAYYKRNHFEKTKKEKINVRSVRLDQQEGVDITVMPLHEKSIIDEYT
eukprot:117777_1